MYVLGEQAVLTHGLFYSVPQVCLDVMHTVFRQDQGQAAEHPHREEKDDVFYTYKYLWEL